MLKYTMKFRIFVFHRRFVPSETMKYLYLFTIFHMGNFSNNAVFFKILLYISHRKAQRNHKIIRDDIVKLCSFQRVFIFLSPEIIKCVESGEKTLHGLPEVFHACLNVTGNEKTLGCYFT